MAPPIVRQALGSPGHPLDAATHSFVSPRFGHDFGAVRIHADSLAAESARAVNAHAYTVGKDIVFGAGRYSPQSADGQKLLLHELTHVVQQRHAVATSRDSVVLDCGSGGLEAEATGAEDRLSLGVSSVPSIRLQRQIGAEQEKICGGSWACAATPCDSPDTAPTSTPATWWKLLVRIDVEAPTPEDVGAKTVGHTYVEFVESTGVRYTYGFYPDPTATADPMFHPDVFGCMVHPDTNHQSCVDFTVTFDLTQKDYAEALQFAQTLCKAPPHYHLLNWNCTTFAVEVAKKAGKSLPSARGKVGGSVVGVTADNPNTLLEGLIPTITLRSDTDIRKWVADHTPATIDALPVEEKIRMINRLLDGWVSDDDLDAIDKICSSVTSAGQMKQIRDKISPRISELSGGASGDRARLRMALSHNP